MSSGSGNRLALAEAAGEAARSSPGVVDLHPGAVGEFATYGAGGRVAGVRIGMDEPPRVTIRVVAEFGCPLGELGMEVRRRARQAMAAIDAAFAEAIIEVHIADVRRSEEQPSQSEGSG